MQVAPTCAGSGEGSRHTALEVLTKSMLERTLNLWVLAYCERTQNFLVLMVIRRTLDWQCLRIASLLIALVPLLFIADSQNKV